MTARTATKDPDVDPAADTDTPPGSLPETDFVAPEVTSDMESLTGRSKIILAALAALRVDFPPNQVGKKPQVTCRDCTQARGSCGKQGHEMARCPICKAWVTRAHADLDFVGHAALTARLLDVDPTWDWEPMALTPGGTPLFTDGGLWIRLTVAGMTRLGYGDGKNPKEIIGDALRNAGMRFGMALGLWHKGGDLYGAEDAATGGTDTTTRQDRAEGAQTGPDPTAADPTPVTLTPIQQARIDDLYGKLLNATSVEETRAVYVEASQAVKAGLPDVDVPWDGGIMSLSTAITRHAAVLKKAEDERAAAPAVTDDPWAVEPPF